MFFYISVRFESWQLPKHFWASCLCLTAVFCMGAANASAPLTADPLPSGAQSSALPAFNPTNSRSAHKLAAALEGPAVAQTVVSTDQVRAELLVLAAHGFGPGQTMWLGLRMTHQPGWHTYWKNPGDSGLPTQLNWQLSPGLLVGETLWPRPHKIRVGDLTNHGFEGQVLLAVPLQMQSSAAASANWEVKLHASWLVCRQECIPQEADFALRIPNRSAQTQHTAEFDALLAQQPTTLPSANNRALVIDQSLRLELINLPAAVHGLAATVFPEAPEVLDAGGENHPKAKVSWQGGIWQAHLPLSAMRTSQPHQLPILLVFDTRPLPRAYRVVLPVQGSWPDLPSPTATATSTSKPALTSFTAPPLNATSQLDAVTWITTLLAALFGGLLLNLMPCVLPVLAIKAVGLAQAQHSAVQRSTQAFAYLMGVVLSFVALGAAMLLLRAGGEQLGWGFQLQSPFFVAFLVLWLSLMAFHLWGLLEGNGLGSFGVAAWHAQHPAVDAFLSGVVAVVLASPCTAPFMGASMGLAVSLPAGQALSLFAALGLGLALPFTLLSLWPAWGRYLPQPGAWMVGFKQLMAFPLMATVVWLLWVLGQQTSLDTAITLLLALLCMAALAWATGLRGAWRTALISLWGAGLVACLWLSSAGMGQPMSNTPAESTSLQQPWQTWSPELVQERLTQSQTVFVDFTAAWCITCQVNKKTTLSDPSVTAAFASQKVALLRADWTRRDSTISAALNALGRSGVPVYVVYRPGKAPQVLSELLTPTEVLQALSDR